MMEVSKPGELIYLCLSLPHFRPVAVSSSQFAVTLLAPILSFEVSQRSQGRDQGLRTGVSRQG